MQASDQLDCVGQNVSHTSFICSAAERCWLVHNSYTFRFRPCSAKGLIMDMAHKLQPATLGRLQAGDRSQFRGDGGGGGFVMRCWPLGGDPDFTHHERLDVSSR